MKHPKRKELVRAAKEKGNQFSEHFKSCDWCRIYFELLQRFNATGELPLISAPNQWIEKAISLAERESGFEKIKSLVAKLTFDSWAMPLPAGVRGEGLLQERRLRFDISDKILDLRAENRRNRWDFVAKVTNAEGKSINCTLVAGKKELIANEDGFYQWSSARPPVKFKILTEEGELETPELSWKRSRAE